MLVRMLTSKGFACCEAEDGVEGLSEMSRMYMRKSKSKCHDISGSADREAERRSLIRVGMPVIENTQQSASPRVSLQIMRTGSRGGVEESDLQHQQFAIDAVLIDSNMPRMNGPEAIVEMRKIGFRGPIIGVSGGDEKTMKEFLQAGADNVMQKPAQSDKLLNMLLAGLQLVVQEATSRNVEQSLLDGNNMCASEMVRQEHIKRLRRFIETADPAVRK